MSVNNLLLVFETVCLKEKFAKKLITIKKIRLMCCLKKKKKVCLFRKLVYSDDSTGTCEINLLAVLL